LEIVAARNVVLSLRERIISRSEMSTLESDDGVGDPTKAAALVARDH
jgi:hypothetical protein